MSEGGRSFLNAKLTLGALGQRNRVTGLHLVRREVHGLAVDQDAAVADELTSLRAGNGETHAVDHVVQAGLEDLQQVLASVAAAG